MTQAPEIFSSARTLLDRLSSGETSAVDLLEAHVARCATVNAAVNAVVRNDLGAARERARELDKMQKSGTRAGPLHGLPITIKDTFDVEGMPATSGAPEYARRSAKTPDAAAVARLRAAGAVIWGKTNTPYLAGDNQTNNLVHGRTSNPWDLNRTPGGSSGGAAAALATGITPLELGSDIGGSLRIPAHFCGVATLKPTFGRAPIMGHVPPAPGSLSVRDLNVAGPMARNVADLRLMFSVLTGEAAVPARKANLKGRRIAVWKDDAVFPLSSECRGAIGTAVEAAGEAGAQTFVAKPEVGDALIDLYLQLLLPILASDMPAPLVKAMEVGRPIARMMARGEPFSRGKWALYSAATHHDWLKADEARQRLKRNVADFFTRWQAIIMPVAPSTAFEHIDEGDAVTRLITVDGKPMPYHAFHSWIALATVCHLPSVVIPVPRSYGELPCGVQIVGPEGSDFELLAIAEALEAEMGGFRRPPEENLAQPLMLTQKVKKSPKARPAPKAAKPKPEKLAKPVKTPKQKPVRAEKPKKPKR
ncbi:MAG: amidase family protein [Hyphomonadaceae bacterium]|nr:amidase family protein [Hyphomonadaceae bacterium]